jgi:hypothetical protein
MNSYIIEHRVRTLANLYGDRLEHGGFEFREWDNVWPPCGAWIARREMQATSALEAINQFRPELWPTLDRIATVSQCYTLAETQSFLIIRQNDNDERIFFLRYVRDRSPSPLGLLDDQRKALKKLEALGDKMHALSFLRDATNAPPSYARLAMLLSTLEALAGERPVAPCPDNDSPRRAEEGEMRRTDMKFIKNKILKDNKLYSNLYHSGPRLRHALAHGREVDLKAHAGNNIDYLDAIYKFILRFINETCDPARPKSLGEVQGLRFVYDVTEGY